MNASSTRLALTPRNNRGVVASIQRPIRRLACVSLMIIFTQLIALPPAMAADAIDREHAIEIAKGLNGGIGKVLGVATTQDASGNTLYAVKLIANGRVRVFKINKAQ